MYTVKQLPLLVENYKEEALRKVVPKICVRTYHPCVPSYYMFVCLAGLWLGGLLYLSYFYAHVFPYIYMYMYILYGSAGMV